MRVSARAHGVQRLALDGYAITLMQIPPYEFNPSHDNRPSIAGEFIELHWRQGAPYGNSVADGGYNILQQNTGRQAAIISIVENLRKANGTLMRARERPELRCEEDDIKEVFEFTNSLCPWIWFLCIGSPN